MELTTSHLRLYRIGHTTVEPGWSWTHETRNSSYFVLWAVMEGTGKLRNGDRAFDAHAGDCYVFRMWLPFEGHSTPGKSMRFWWAWLQVLDDRGRPVDLTKRQDGELPAMCRRLESSTFFDALLQRLRKAHQQQGAAAPGVQAWLHASLSEVERCGQLPAFVGVQKEQYDRIQELCARIQNKPGLQYRIKEIARTFGYSTEHFSRIFRKYTGMSPRQYVTLTRLEAAKSLLHSSNYNLTAIAEQLGFNDIYHFSREFKAHAGLSASAYRRTLHRQE
jgi:AraC family transcriptional regulator of arabinose operon